MLVLMQFWVSWKIRSANFLTDKMYSHKSAVSGVWNALYLPFSVNNFLIVIVALESLLSRSDTSSYDRSGVVARRKVSFFISVTEIPVTAFNEGFGFCTLVLLRVSRRRNSSSEAAYTVFSQKARESHGGFYVPDVNGPWRLPGLLLATIARTGRARGQLV